MMRSEAVVMPARYTGLWLAGSSAREDLLDPSLSMILSDHRVLSQPGVLPIYLNKLSLDLSAPIWEYKVTKGQKH